MIAFVLPGWLHAAWVTAMAVALLILRYFQKKDANAKPDAVTQARNDSAADNDAALNADLDAARDRMRDHQGGPNQQ